LLFSTLAMVSADVAAAGQLVKKEFVNRSPRIYMIFSRPRSGTNMLEDFLDSNQELQLDHGSNEIMADYGPKFENTPNETLWHWSIYEAELLRVLMDIRAKNPGRESCGVTIMYGQGGHRFVSEYAKFAERLDIPIIHLVRKNKLRIVISWKCLLHQFEVWRGYDRYHHGNNYGHALDATHLEKLRRFKPWINTDTVYSDLTRMVKTEQEIDHKLQSAAHPKLLSVVYEEIYSVLDQWNNKFLAFLGLRQRQLSTKQQQVHAGPVDDLVENPELLRQALIHTEFAWMLDD